MIGCGPTSVQEGRVFVGASLRDIPVREIGIWDRI
jgi:hypothetical protein